MLRLIPPPPQAMGILRKAGIRAQERQLQAHSTQTLMSLAGLSAARLTLAIAPHARRVWIAAGPGNNGGDGLEAACHLHRWGIPVQVSLMAAPDQLPDDALAAWKKAVACGVPLNGEPDPLWVEQMDERDLCLDALLGIGAHRPPSGRMQSWVSLLNRSAAPVLALDVPTGLDADSGQVWAGPAGPQQAVQAHTTLTFVAAKPGLLMGHGRDLCGNLWLDPLTSACPSPVPPAHPDAVFNTPTTAAARRHASHKGSQGDVAVVGGESRALQGMAGAAILAAQAALHGGAGRVYLSLLGEPGVHQNIPTDAMPRPLDQLNLGSLTVVAGCGAGQAIQALLPDILRNSARLVLDADGLNALAHNPSWLAQLRARGEARPTVITPHPLEAARLLNCSTQEVQNDRLGAAQTLSRTLQCTVVLKGSGSVIASPDHLPRINTSGNGKLAIGGTGDVLAGWLGALLGQGQGAHQAACAAVWRHGHAADEWPDHVALTASRLAQQLY